VHSLHLLHPSHLLLVPPQAQGAGGGELKYKGMRDVFTKTLQNEGVRGLYKVGAGQAGQRSKAGSATEQGIADPVYAPACYLARMPCCT
jgi:hypothetical protein